MNVQELIVELSQYPLDIPVEVDTSIVDKPGDRFEVTGSIEVFYNHSDNKVVVLK